MRKTVGVLVVVLLALFAVKLDRPKMKLVDPPAVEQEPGLAVLARIDPQGEIEGYGNAFLVDSENCLYATAAHIVTKGERFMLFSAPDRHVAVSLAGSWVDPFSDIAIVQAQNLRFCRGLLALPLAPAPPEKSQLVRTVGYCPLGFPGNGDTYAAGCSKSFVVRKPRTDFCIDPERCLIRDQILFLMLLGEDIGSDIMVLHPEQIYAGYAGSPFEPGLIRGMSGSPLLDGHGTVVGIAHMASNTGDGLFASSWVAKELLEHVQLEIAMQGR